MAHDDLTMILDRARDELKEWMVDNPGEDTGDIIFEIADGNVPVYIGVLMQLAADNIELAVDEPEIGPAFDGSPTPVNIVAANVYEAIANHLYREVDEIKDEIDEEAPDVADGDDTANG